MHFEKVKPEDINLQLLQESQYKNIIWPIIFNDELWVQISTFLPQVKDYYWISNYGRLYSAAVGYCIIPYPNRGYMRISLQLKDSIQENPDQKNEIYIGIHRLVAMAFLGMPPYDSYQPNHKDSNRGNNLVSNLEWTTPKENMQHASKYGYMKKGENHAESVYTEIQVRQICELMQSGIYDAEEICQKVFGDGKSGKYKALIYKIRSRKFWNTVSCDYTFDPPPKKEVINIDQINAICKYLESHNNALTTEISMNVLGIDLHSMDKKEAKKLSNIILNIKNKKTYPEITSKYNF